MFGIMFSLIGDKSGILINSNPDKPVIITEFGADALPGLFGEKDGL